MQTYPNSEHVPWENADFSDHERIGLDYWMDRVIQECDGVSLDFKPELIHDLRVALRRCRSIADGFMSMDPHRAWAEMKKEGGRLFRRLGELRDTQVMLDWIERLSLSAEPEGSILASELARREEQLKNEARESLQEFKRKKWASWSRQLSKRFHRLPLESPVFLHMALEHCSHAHLLHKQALRNRSRIAFHRLRIGLKRFRYIVENFLPGRHAQWGPDLRELQCLLGEIHDLDVLWGKALQSEIVKEPETRLRWRSRIDQERRRRIDGYRSKMVGKTSLWQVWRAGLPGPAECAEAALARLHAWASFRDPDISHAEHVAQLALELYDALDSQGLIGLPEVLDARTMLHAAALLHHVGLAKTAQKHHKASYRFIRKLKPPMGWTSESLLRVALIVRYHRGAFPGPGHKRLDALAEQERRLIHLISGILRLAAVMDSDRSRRIQLLAVKKTESAIIIHADGYNPDNDNLGKKLARARYPLERCCNLPVLFCGPQPAVSSAPKYSI
jgi:CHAD domain-containing protein